MIGVSLWCVVIAVATSLLVWAVALLFKGMRLGENREKWHDQTTGPAGAMFNALFLASFALSVVIAWQAYDHAKTDTADEASSLTALYNDVGGLPNGTQLRHEINDYATLVVDQEWPLLPQGGSSVAADQRLTEMSAQILSVQTDQDSIQATRSETVKELDAVSAARDLRLQDANTALPAGLLICLVVTALVVLSHGLIVGSPHTPASLIPLLTEAALIAGAVYIIFVIRRPYHGALDIGPDQIRLAMARFSQSS